MTPSSASAPSNRSMLINYAPGDECRVAVLTDGKLDELHSERAGAVSFVGNIYVGKVTNVEPAIQAAFVDFGLESNGFLHITDLHPRYFPGDENEATETIGKKTPRRERPPIQACLRRGQEVIVQVLKEGINTKGPTLTSYLSIPGRYLVMLPDMDRVGVSRKVEDEDARREMRKILDTLDLPEGFGFILRTAGMDQTKTELKRDLAYLLRLWKDIERRRGTGKGPRLLYAESDLLMRVLRDVWTTDIGEIVIDNEAALKRAASFLKIVAPRGSVRLLHYDRPTPLFHASGVEPQIKRIFAREVPLPSGGALVIDETEAMIAIDVNSGKNREARDAETTAFNTNREAVEEICRQLRLRDVGGLVLCDLIDMHSRSHRRDIENQFKDLLKLDRAATRALPISQFGIVELTRQRVRGSVRSAHFAKCPKCSGSGHLQRPDSVAADVMRDLCFLLAHNKVKRVEVVVSPRVAGELLSSRRRALTALEVSSDKTVDVRVSEDIQPDRTSYYAYDENGADIDLMRLPKPRLPHDLPEWKHETAAGADDWAMDARREQTSIDVQALLPRNVDEAAALNLDDPLLANYEPSDDDRGAAPSPLGLARAGSDEEGEGGRRRRRRRRRGRGDRGGPDRAEAGPPARATGERGHAPRAHEDSEPSEDRREQSMSAPGGGAAGEGGSGDEGGRRRRRRRRRGRGRGEVAANGAAEPAAPGGPRQNDIVEDDAPEGAPDWSADRSAAPRGDSWDVSPGELAAQKSPAAGGSDDSYEDEAEKRSADDRANEEEKGDGDTGVDDIDSDEDLESREGDRNGSSDDKDNDGKRKKRRRRGRRGRGKRAVGAEGEQPQPKAQPDRPSEDHRDQPREAPKKAPNPERPPARPAASVTPPPGRPGAASANPSGVPEIKPVTKRTLFGTRRKIAGPDATRARGRDE